jgi:hypothetical protein
MGQYKNDLRFLAGALGAGALTGEQGLDMFLGAQGARDQRRDMRRQTMQGLMGSSIEAAQAGSSLDQIRAELEVIAPAYGLKNRQINKLDQRLENKVFPYGADKPSVFAAMWDQQDDGVIATKVQELFANDQRFMEDRATLRQVIAEDMKNNLGTELYQELADEMNASIDRAFSSLGGKTAAGESLYEAQMADRAGMTVEEYQKEQSSNPITDAIDMGGALGYVAGGVKTLDDWFGFGGLQELSKGSEAFAEGENGLGDIAEGAARLGGAAAFDLIGGPIIGKAIGGAGRFGANVAGRAFGDDSARLAGRLFGLDDIAQDYLGATHGRKIGNAITEARTVLPSQRGRLASAARFLPMGNFIGDVARGRAAHMSTLGGLDEMYGVLGGGVNRTLSGIDNFSSAMMGGAPMPAPGQIIDEAFIPSGIDDVAGAGMYSGIGSQPVDPVYLTDAAYNTPSPYEPNWASPGVTGAPAQAALPRGPANYGSVLNAAESIPPGPVVPPEWLPTPGLPRMVADLVEAGVPREYALRIADSLPPNPTMRDVEVAIAQLRGGAAPFDEAAVAASGADEATESLRIYNTYAAQEGNGDWVDPGFLNELRWTREAIDWKNPNISESTYGLTARRHLPDGSIEHVSRETGEVLAITYQDGATVPIVHPADYRRVHPDAVADLGQQGGGVLSPEVNNVDDAVSQVADLSLYRNLEDTGTYDQAFGLHGVSPEDVSPWGYHPVYDEYGDLAGYQHIDFENNVGSALPTTARDVPEMGPLPSEGSFAQGPAAWAANPQVDRAVDNWIRQMIGNPQDPRWREVYAAYNEAVSLGQIPADYGVGRFMREWMRGF